MKGIMGRSCFLTFLLISAVLALSFSQGFGRKAMYFEKGDSTVLFQGNSEKAREMIEVMDYSDPGPNTNPSGFLVSPPPSPQGSG